MAELLAMSFHTRRGSRVHAKKMGVDEVRLQISHPNTSGSMRAGLDPSQRRKLAAFLLDGIEDSP